MDGHQRTLTGTLVLRGPGWVACRVVAWLGRPEAVGRWHARDEDLMTLLDALDHARDPRAAECAAAVVESMWVLGGTQRARLWATIWSRVRGHAGHWCASPPSAVLRLLLAPEPDCRHEPRVRLVAGLSLPAEPDGPLADDVARTLLTMATRWERREDDRLVADVLARTDQPALLTALAREFTRGLDIYRDPWATRTYHVELWTRTNGATVPAQLLEILQVNPHLPAATQVLQDTFDVHQNVVFLLLRGRFDLVARLDGRAVVDTVIQYVDRAHALPSELVEACRRILRELPPGSGPQAVCDIIMTTASRRSRDVAAARYSGAEYAEAVAAARDAGYLPADPQVLPEFLERTGQWRQLEQVRPLEQRLAEYRSQAEGGDMQTAVPAAARLLRLLRTDSLPEVSRETVSQFLRDIGPGPVRDHLCQRAMEGDATASSVVVEAGHLPSVQERIPAFLYLTEQWERYDDADPDGSRLRAYTGRLDGASSQRDRLRAAARSADRPVPCKASQPRRVRVDPRPYIPPDHPGRYVRGSGSYIPTSFCLPF